MPRYSTRYGLIPARAGNTSRGVSPAACFGAHPRSRGDHWRCSFAVRRASGSSPLARGPHTLLRAERLTLGLIPARAGTTWATPPLTRCRRAHPRSRGDHPASVPSASGRAGSSPLARGPHYWLRFQYWCAGLIPARAGTTLSVWVVRFPGRAHPRSRGDHSVPQVQVKPPLGSSPLARGPQEQEEEEVTRWGLIPARAGNTSWAGSRRTSARAHPRSRGEHCWVWLVVVKVQGSSPLARGTPKDAGDRLSLNGLIPARAGNTRPSTRYLGAPGAHPRSRGEHPRRWRSRRLNLGSSPLARGTLINVGKRNGQTGLIPARAGNTLTPESCHSAPGAHPRSRGEHRLPLNTVYEDMGSSPLARGTRLLWFFDCGGLGLIPARAGNTNRHPAQ